MIVSAPESAQPAGAPAEAARAVGPGLEAVRRHAPLVQAVTNTVVAGFTANVLLALGAAPAMVDIPGEAAPFAAAADGLLVNLGTPHRESAEAMLDAARAASAVGTPWVLDPVAIGVLPVRTRLAAELLALRPSVIRGNASEIIALAGRGSGGRGVDATDDAESALDAALELAGGHGAASGRTVVAVSGPVDLITDGERVVRGANGSPLLTRVTGGGCALGAVMAAFAGAAQAAHSAATEGPGTAVGAAPAGPDLFGAVASAVTAYNVAAEHAAAVVSGPGSFAVAFLDALAAVTPEDAVREGRLS